jgi:hypothetical protein
MEEGTIVILFVSTRVTGDLELLSLVALDRGLHRLVRSISDYSLQFMCDLYDIACDYTFDALCSRNHGLAIYLNLIIPYT